MPIKHLQITSVIIIAVLCLTSIIALMTEMRSRQMELKLKEELPNLIVGAVAEGIDRVLIVKPEDVQKELRDGFSKMNSELDVKPRDVQADVRAGFTQIKKEMSDREKRIERIELTIDEIQKQLSN